MKLTILTATYNRSQLLERLYKSIESNLYDKLDIEWLIMDDGSEDNTQEVVSKFRKNKNLDVKYFKQVNQGKMQALNNLMQYVTGDLVMDCDSDDYFVNGAFAEIYNNADVLLSNPDLYGLVFLKNENKNKLSGNKFSTEDMKTTMFDMYFKDNITGEKIILFKTSIRKQYKHELMDGEKFITEARMYHKMDEMYSVKCFNIVIIEGEYCENGYTHNIIETFKKYPKGYFEYFKEILQKDMTGVIFKKRLYAIKHYILFKSLCGYKGVKIKGIYNKILYYLLFIPGTAATKMRFKMKCE